jgi:zinc finger BED domain-containing protein 1 (E3 SUMO-protein ligase ZBED1)
MSTLSTKVSYDKEDLEDWLSINEDASKVHVLKKPGRNKQSPIWRLYHEVFGVQEDADPEEVSDKWNERAPAQKFACCNKCGSLVSIGNKNKAGKFKQSTAGINSHLQNSHGFTLESIQPKLQQYDIDMDPDLERKAKRQKASAPQGSIIAFAKSGPIKLSAKDAKLNQELRTTEYILDCMLPFNTVEQESFRKMIESHNRNAAPMGNRRVKAIIMTLEAAMREASTAQLAGKDVSITLDHWTSKANQNYTGLTAHYIDNDWVLVSVPLGIFLHEGGSTAEELEKDFLKVWHETLKNGDANLFCATTDTTANMNSFGLRLEALGHHHVYCTDHNYHLTCKHAIKSENSNLPLQLSDNLMESIDKAKAHVTYFNKSSQGLDKLKKAQGEKKQLGVVTDVVTRWWSTLDMLERMIKLKPFIVMLRAQGDLKDIAKMEDADWDNINEIAQVLRPFREAMNTMEGSKYVTASSVAATVKFIRKTLKAAAGDPHDTARKRIAKVLLDDFELRWFGNNNSLFDGTVRRGAKNRQIGIHPILLIATFLDPRFKDLGSVPDEADKERIRKHVLNLMVEIETKNRAAAPTMEEAINTALEEESDDDESGGGMLAMMEDDEQAASQETTTQITPGQLSIEDFCKAELSLYMGAPKMDLTYKDNKTNKKAYNDPLLWWKTHESKFLMLRILAKKFLAVQATSAPSERIFSQASLLISAKRTQMSPRIAGKALYVKQNWKHHEEDLDYLNVIGGSSLETLMVSLAEDEDE